MGILDSYGLDCNQSQIIEALLKQVQPNEELEMIPVFIAAFHEKSIPVDISEKNNPSKKSSITLKILVYPADHNGTVSSGWSPELEKDKMKEYKVEMVVVERKPDQEANHAMYLKDFEKKLGVYTFLCINSQGENAGITLKQSEVAEVYYIQIVDSTVGLDTDTSKRKYLRLSIAKDENLPEEAEIRTFIEYIRSLQYFDIGNNAINYLTP